MEGRCHLPAQIYPIPQDKANHCDRTATARRDGNGGPRQGRPPLSKRGNAGAKQAVGVSWLRGRGGCRGRPVGRGELGSYFQRKPHCRRQDVNAPPWVAAPLEKASDLSCTPKAGLWPPCPRWAQ